MAKKKAPEEGAKHKNNPNVIGLRAEVLEQPITETLEVNYMPYAMSVIVSRAIPEIDGFKPSHRKLLYTMYKMGLLTGARTKSANIVGQTMKLNPHGDAAIYDTMVRLSRGYGALLHPLVDSKGNFGKVYSRDMAWAASRYTEARLDNICSEFFRDIDQDTVDFADNYDGSMKEPTLLPTTFPNVLVSSNMGIAVGMASNICGFNLGEVCDATIEFLKNPDCDLLGILKAPDFPTGGELLYDGGELSNIYRTGRGSFKVRSKWRYLKAENLIEIYEIPYSTTVEAIMDKVAELIKSGKIKEIADMRDETDLTGLKLAIDLKRGTDPDKLMQKLFRSTPMMDSFGCNFNILIAGMPRVMGIREILDEWTAWRMDSVRRRTYFVMKKKQDKLHLLKGLKKILLDIDRAIKIIRETEEDSEVIPNLMIGFGIDDIQAEYVADIKLRNINKEYILRRIEETSDLEAEIADLQDIVNNPGRVKKLIIAELQNVKKKFAVPRRTDIIYEHQMAAEPDPEEEIPDYPATAFLSREGYFKKITAASLRMNSEQKYKEGDGPFLQWECTNRDELLVFTDAQQCYKTRLSDFDDAKASVLGDYLPTKLGFDEGEGFVWACIPGDYSGNLLFFFKNGKAARVELAAYQTQTRRKKLTGAYSDKSPLAAAFLLREDLELAVISTEGRCMVFHTAALAPKATRSTQGVNVMTLKPKYSVETVKPLGDTPIVNISRYRARSLPIAGALLREEDRGEEQMTLL
ncbi:topoisomerase IV [Pseudoflavonifractor sp. BIOML-A6]|nr:MULTISPECIES: DNA topoisomerase (ATP-hydrolyzing) subunit A [unclassified Pseudoflavonifractor]MTQ95554.1 topoisomerase IV [Pseudoflavonifractor sp. BIOML-A16]MTR05434.1 topoisomerase IV [Pseudoflavonifractor sp. BIOML-A15]MTR31443.1 topoisomerase IV [Pseudoflavonifractor sp. BIOML-A14]MTR73312.1 topoisomerase IV [Pseudoflavonifractor sp. BIOML-A18]MTS64042.1 topoisomerase IV [Pseudoflavonifractor sp. BIOML-A5]MTS72042.1 topoisomerase IV [Pseudoflavonifractor sp. BIOML-A8]MTS89574.1 topoi